MSLLDEAREASRVDPRGPSCDLGAWLAAQNDDVRADVQTALDAPWTGPGKVMHTALLDSLNAKYGTEFTIDKLRHHRRGHCRCVR